MLLQTISARSASQSLRLGKRVAAPSLYSIAARRFYSSETEHDVVVIGMVFLSPSSGSGISLGESQQIAKLPKIGDFGWRGDFRVFL